MLDFHCILIKTVSGCPSKDQSQRRRSVLKRGDGGHLPHSLGPGSLLEERGKNNRLWRKKWVSEASREVIWGGERVAIF